VRGNLCDVQLPYDEHLLDARHALAGRVSRAARDVARRDPDAAPALRPVLTRFDLPVDDVDPAAPTRW
jgi:hypothetical protein